MGIQGSGCSHIKASVYVPRFGVAKGSKRRIMHMVVDGSEGDMIEPVTLTIRTNEENLPSV